MDSEGLAALTLVRLAAALGVAPPSLYKHIASLTDLTESITLMTIHSLADNLTAAVLGRADHQALIAASDAYRCYATDHPELYSLIQRPVRTDLVTHQNAVARIVAIIEAIVKGYGLKDQLVIHAIRVVRSGLHGFCDLETRGGLQRPESLDESFSLLVNALHASLVSLGRIS